MSDNVKATADAVHPIRVRILKRTQSASKPGSFLRAIRLSIKTNKNIL